MHWCQHARAESAAARYRRLWRRGRDATARRDDEAGEPHEPLRRIARPPAYEPGRNNKLRLMTDYFRHTPRSRARLGAGRADRRALVPACQAGHDPRADRRAHRSGAVRPVLRLCRRSLRNGRADVAGLAGAEAATTFRPCPKSSTTLSTLGKAQLPAQLARWLDALDETGRWALLKLVTGGLRIGVSARLAKTAAAALGDKDVDRDRTALARA